MNRSAFSHPATWIALLALFVALSGSAYAVSQLAPNSVGAAQLKSNAVTSAKVKNRSLRAVDFAAGQLPAGPKGADGDPGPQGESGPAGPTASAGLEVYPFATLTASPEPMATLSADAAQTLTLSGPMRVVAQAQVGVYKTTTDYAKVSTVACRMQYRSLPDGSFTDLSPFSELFLPAAPASISVHGEVPLMGSVTLAAGSYDLRVTCLYENNAAFSTTDAYVSHVAMTAVAAAS